MVLNGTKFSTQTLDPVDPRELNPELAIQKAKLKANSIPTIYGIPGRLDMVPPEAEDKV